MLTRYLAPWLLFLWTILGFAQMGQAEIDWQVKKTIKTSGAPLATAISEDGQKIFVLNGGGRVEIFSEQGEPLGTLEVGATAKSIAIAPSGEQLLVTDTEKQAIRIVNLDFVIPLNLCGAPFRGYEKAPVAIAVFSDFQCPYCAKLLPLLTQALEHNPDKVKVVFMNYPLPSHRFSQQAALSALAAGRQGKFWEMHDKIFANYSSLDENKFAQFATELGLDLERFNNEVKDPTLRERINTDIIEANKARVRGTPTLFVNGRLLKEKSLVGIQEMVDAELKKIGK